MPVVLQYPSELVDGEIILKFEYYTRNIMVQGGVFDPYPI